MLKTRQPDGSFATLLLNNWFNRASWSQWFGDSDEAPAEVDEEVVVLVPDAYAGDVIDEKTVFLPVEPLLWSLVHRSQVKQLKQHQDQKEHHKSKESKLEQLVNINSNC